MVFRRLKLRLFRLEGMEPRAVSDGTTLLFGLPGVQVERGELLADGTRVCMLVSAAGSRGGMPGVWGGVHVGQGAGAHLGPVAFPTARTKSSCEGQDPLALSGGLLPARVVHRGHCAGPGADAHHPTVAHPDWRDDR